MSAATNFLDLDIDALFERHSINEIEAIQRKVQAEAENKRNELRTMVGERYRDLLQAADTIIAMRDSADTLISQLDATEAHCRRLQALEFYASDGETAGIFKTKQQQHEYGTVAQIKLLSSLPELIWTHIDREQFHVATQLYSFAQHISTGLHLNEQDALVQRLPVARQLWELLRPFSSTIKLQITRVLEREELSAEQLTDCLLSLLLLDSVDIGAIWVTFLDIRAQTYARCLDVQSADNGRRIKTRILASLKLLNGTLELLQSCLLDGGLFYQRMSSCRSPDAPTCLALLELEHSEMFAALPTIISTYRPKYETQNIAAEQLEVLLTAWLQKITELTDTKLNQAFELVRNMQTIQELKSEASKLKCQHQVTFDDARVQRINFYELYYLPLFSRRVHDIIEESLSIAIDKIFSVLRETLKSLDSEENTCDIWQEFSSDLPTSLAIALSEDMLKKQLLLLMRGYDASIVRICVNFNAQLKSIIDEMDVLLQEENTPADYKLALIEFLRETTKQQLTDFVSRVKSLRLQERRALLYTVRCCIAIIELCPQLQVCFSQQSSWRQWLSGAAADGIQHWQRFCALLVDEIEQLWLQIVDDILAEIELPTEELVATDILLKDVVNWQTVTLDQPEDGEEEPSSSKAQTSTIRIPCQPRISLQLHLFAVVRTLNRCVPQTLPTKVLQTFNKRLLHKLLAHYDCLASNESVRGFQNAALQLYFDLKFLHGLFALVRDERALSAQFNALQSKFADCIDPFDMEIFSEHIATNLKRSVARLSCQFGVLSTPATSTKTSSTTTTQALQATLAHETDPNVLALSASGSSSVWFPLLPIVVPPPVVEKASTTKFELDKPETPTRKVANTRKADASKAKSTAASFFGMSPDWFR